MRGYVTTCRGEKLELPVPLEWEMNYTAGVPCDSFRLRCPWDQGQDTDPADYVRFEAIHRGETVFTGVVDECELVWSTGGSRLELSGRGMAALLLDNEAEARDYETAALEDILREHVRPYGIRVAEQRAMPAVSHFSVSAGSSEWAVLYEFSRFHGGVTPRFNQRGQLILSGWTDSANLVIGDGAPVTEMRVRDRRYGVVSEIWVRNRKRQTVDRVRNEAFIKSGGQCRRIVTIPTKSAFKTARYSGGFQLEKSASALKRLEVTVAVPFYGKPGDLVQLNRKDWSMNGTYRVIEVQVSADEQGSRTTLILAQPDVVL